MYKVGGLICSSSNDKAKESEGEESATGRIKNNETN